MTVDTIQYYPRHLRNIKEFTRLATVTDAKLEEVWAGLDRLALNMYLTTMDEDTCAKWEALLGITVNSNYDLDDRRTVIIGYFSSDLPYTEKKMNEVLTAMYGSDAYKLVIDASVGLITICVYLAAQNAASIMYERIRAMAPADMGVVVSIVYNRHSTYTAYTHEALSAYTHEQLRSDEQFQT